VQSLDSVRNSRETDWNSVQPATSQTGEMKGGNSQRRFVSIENANYDCFGRVVIIFRSDCASSHAFFILRFGDATRKNS
jgi:hypothetical protein